MQTTHESTDDLRSLMEEPAYGANEGRSTPTDPEGDTGRLSNNPKDWQSREFMQSGGFGTVVTNAGTQGGRTYGYLDMGLATHRGTLHPDEHVDHDALLAMVETHLGFTFDEVRSVYTRAGGPLPVALRELRAKIDGRLLELHTADHINLVEFARVMGLTEMGMHRAVVRAERGCCSSCQRPRYSERHGSNYASTVCGPGPCPEEA